MYENVLGGIVLKLFWWDFRFVLMEELIFCGVLLYILFNRMGFGRGILIFVIVFGIYYWFLFGVLGNVMVMILVFIGMGLMGYVWVWVFVKIKFIMFFLGLYLGWNFIYNMIFLKGLFGDLVLILEGGEVLIDWFLLLNFVSGLIIVLLLIFFYVRYFVEEEVE